ncbi:MAG: TniB family NTP-binding protein [Thiovulaceae bacterium]|nr:TniB family NTP-binding protein [Sulfurimonadaceae bacterium]
MMQSTSALPNIDDLKNADDEERISFIRKTKWLNYPLGQKILDQLEDLKKYEQNKSRVTSILIIGSGNSGKTALLNRFMEIHPPYDMFESNPDRLTTEFFNEYNAFGIPVVYIAAPAEPSETRLYSIILNTLSAPFKERDTVSRKQFLVEYYCKVLHVEVLIIDEIHNILAGSPAKQRQMMNSIKNLSNNLKIPIVLAGIKDALRAVSTDTQISSRFRPVYLPKWTMDQDYISLLGTIDSILPLRKKSSLLTTSVALEILKRSHGILGHIIGLTQAAAIHAIKTKSEKITLNEIQNCEYDSGEDTRDV